MLLPDYEKARKRTKNEVLKEEYVQDRELELIGKGRLYFIKTYGCQMNEHDTENIKAMLESVGFCETDIMNQADLVMLNTCSIRENAHNKAFGMLGRIKHLKETNKDLIVGICGCMAQEEGVVSKLLDKFKWVNFVMGTHNIHRLPVILNKAINDKWLEVEVLSVEGNIVENIPVKRDNKYRAYVNIIYGCDKFCTYCIVPMTRGKQRSRDPRDIIKEVEELVVEGYKEVTLLGQNVNAYGKDLGIDYGMENLLEDVAKTNIPRIKFVTSHPWDFTLEMIDVIAKNENIMPYIHLPIQSGSNKILKAMNRKYKKEDYLTLVNNLREKIPNVSVSTDIIVGFPGETKEDFLETINVYHEVKYDFAYTFIFSKRKGTLADDLEDLTPEIEKEERLQTLNKIVNSYALESNKKLEDKVESVLVEGDSEKSGYLFGYTKNMKLVNFMGSTDLVGKIVNIKIIKAKSFSLDGELC